MPESCNRGFLKEWGLSSLLCFECGGQECPSSGNVYSEKTLAAGWGKVKSNAGACGVDGITIERFGKQAKERLLMERVGEYIADGRVLGMIEGFLKAGVMEMIEPGSHFDFLGLFSLEAAQAMEQTSLREGAN